MTVNDSLRQYIESEILPRYDRHDTAHRRDHAYMVIARSMELAQNHEADPDMAYTVAAYHDTGLCEGREVHHLASGRIIRSDVKLRDWFSDEQIETIAQAAEDHRASGKNPPRSIYGLIVAEADRLIDPHTVIRRTIQYGISHYPELDKEGHFRRMTVHLKEKYAEGGYLKLWLEDSPNAESLEELRSIIRDDAQLRRIFDAEYDTLF